MKPTDRLFGKSKKEIVEEMGQEFNYYPERIWTFQMKKYWWGQKKFLILYFEEEIVVKMKMKIIYGKINTSKL
mgnify:CR=1 FL=1